MQLKTLLPAALAWSASALLLPPPVDSDGAISSIMTGPTITEVHVPCPGCDVAQDKLPGSDVRPWDVTGDKNTYLRFRFSLSDTRDRLFLNDQPFFPFDPSNPVPPVAVQVADDSESSFPVTADELPLSARIDLGQAAPFVGAPGVSVRQVSIEVLGLEDRVVHVGTVVIEVFENTDGVLSISNPIVVPTITTLRDALCDTVLCRARAQIADKMAMIAAAAQKVKNGCLKMLGMQQGSAHEHKGMTGSTMPHDQAENNKAADGGRLSHLRGGPKKFGHGGHGKKPCNGRVMGRLAHWFGIFVRHVLLPVMIGIAAGMAVSAIGMVIGQLIFMIYMRLRGERQGYVAVYQVEVDDEDVEAEPLPRYEAGDHVLPPAYSDEKEESE